MKYCRLVWFSENRAQSNSSIIKVHFKYMYVQLSFLPQAPNCVTDFLQPSFPDDIIFRWLTIVGNIMTTRKEGGLTSGDLPTDYKAASPETMYTSLYGLNHNAKLKSKVFVLSRHGNEEIRNKALRLYAYFT